ncbi:MAG: hypothetical protein AMXMBFR83_01290 [Phycisphaerae bacterium]
MSSRFSVSGSRLLLPFFLASSAWAADWVIPREHPRLLITRDDVSALRVRCGTAPGGDDAAGTRGPIGSQREALARLRAAANEIMKGPPRADDLYAPALLHLLTGDPQAPDAYSRYVADALLNPDRRLFEMDAIVALDWCWDALAPSTRRQILERLPLVPQRLDGSVSPVDHLTFQARLCGLAQAVCCHDRAAPADDVEVLEEIISAGFAYLTGPFADFCRRKGALPTSSANGIWEEADAVLAVELLRTGLGHNLWPALADSLGRCLEHYFYADTESPLVAHGFIHDDGTQAPARPGQVYRGFVPAVPFAVARQVRDPIATWYAARALPRTEPSVSDVERYLWVRLIYGPVEGAEAARRACPLGRHFGGGWVAMRSGWEPGETVLLFDAGQPFWRSRQHFDAGHFLIYRKGRLTLQSGDDVTFEAVPQKQGGTFIGGRPDDWDRYFQSTIAHNCITVFEPGRPGGVLYGRPWPAAGNQRLIAHDYAPAQGTPAQAGRQTGKLIAFETNTFFTYAAADLTPAYSPENVQELTRHVLMAHKGIVLVLDRLVAARDRSVKTFHLQLPSAPVDLTTQGGFKQVFGTDRNAGIWELTTAQGWLQVNQGQGSLLVRTLLPANGSRRVIGGPMKPQTIPIGPLANRVYYGAAPGGFEYRMAPATILHAPSAYYKLGNPNTLGDSFGTGSAWGRYDVSPSEPTNEIIFLHLLVPGDSANVTVPEVNVEAVNAPAMLNLRMGSELIRIDLENRNRRPTHFTQSDKDGNILFKKELKYSVSDNPPLPSARLPFR